MTNKKRLVLGFLLIAFCLLCHGQTKAIHFTINGISLGQSISLEEVQSHFHDYEEDGYLFDNSGKITLLFKEAQSFDEVPIPIDKIEFGIENGVLQEIELRITIHRNEEYGKEIFNHIYSRYGIHDRGPNRYPNLVLSSIGVYKYEWLGANGVTLSLWERDYGGRYVYLRCEGRDRSSSRMSSILEKLNSSTL